MSRSRRTTTTPVTNEARAEAEAVHHRRAREQAISALSVLTPNVA
jgi:hypothetical protein